MAYSSLAQCVKDLETQGQLRRIEVELDPVLEIAAVQRRVFAAQGPALLFTNVRGTSFPLVANLFGTKERLYTIFRDELPSVRRIARLAKDIGSAFSRPMQAISSAISIGGTFSHMLFRRIPPRSAPILANSCSLAELPHLVSWPEDGGAFITLPLVYSEDPTRPGVAHSNLGMYRVQLSGNLYASDEVGLHYQIHRGIGVHHAHAIEKGLPFPVTISVGGPPALTLAAIMPLPEGISELRFAGLLGGQGVGITQSPDGPLPLLADADFCIQGVVAPVTKPEGPFGDHMGYYSLEHSYPVVQVTAVTHRTNAIWPFTTVGRPPQEDTVFGAFIHELTAPFVSQVFPGVAEVHAVDCAGVHPLLLAVGAERYVPYEAQRKPREILTQALHLLGNTQTALAKYLLIAAREDAPGLSVRDVPGFFRYVLERTDFANDLHFLPNVPCDTLDYTGTALNEGSKLIWAVAGPRRRVLGTELSDVPRLPQKVAELDLIAPGILLVTYAPHTMPRGEQDAEIAHLADILGAWEGIASFPLVVVVDNIEDIRSFEDFLWVTFTRSDPAVDCYGCQERVRAKQWQCQAPFVIDARAKAFHPKPLVEDPATVARIESLAVEGGPLAGLW